MVNTGSLCGEVYEDHIDVGKSRMLRKRSGRGLRKEIKTKAQEN